MQNKQQQQERKENGKAKTPTRHRKMHTACCASRQGAGEVQQKNQFLLWCGMLAMSSAVICSKALAIQICSMPF